MFAWTQFGTCVPIVHVADVIYDPAGADQELRNVEQLNQKVAVVKRGGNNFGEKARRPYQVGTLTMIIINSDNDLFTVKGDDFGIIYSEGSRFDKCPVVIPVVLTASDAGPTLMYKGSHVTLVGDLIDILKTFIVAGVNINLVSHHRIPNL